MTNNIYSPARRLLACLLALFCLLSIGAFGGLHAWADETEEAGSNTEAAVSGPYAPIDLTKPCSLTIYPSGSTDIQNDLKDAVFKVDVYQFAAAKEIPGVDSYDYTLTSAFTSLQTLLDAAREKKTATEEKSAAELSREAWESLAQAAAALIKDGSGGTPVTVAKTDSETNVAVSNLGAGLYLLVARSDESGYWSGTGGKDDPIKSVAHSEGYNYLFAPQLVSLPYKSAEMVEPGEKDDPVMTSDDAPWVYAVTIYLKPEQQGRYANLVIKKTLQNYKGDGSMLFIFYVDAVNSKGDNVYSAILPIELSKDNLGPRYALAENVPIGTTVTVWEKYPGAACKQIYPPDLNGYSGTMTVNGLDTEEYGVLQTLSFINEGSGGNHGGGIENTFEKGTSGIWDIISQNMTPGLDADPLPSPPPAIAG